MANSFIKLYIHFVFAVKYRTCLISPLWRSRLHQYIKKTISAKGHTCVCVGGTDDHVHILVDFNGTEAASDFIRDIKSASSKFVNEAHLSPFRFSWQRGFGCFSYNSSSIPTLVRYIENQEQHHKCQSLKDEMITMLTGFNIDYKPEYLLDDFEDGPLQ